MAQNAELSRDNNLKYGKIVIAIKTCPWIFIMNDEYKSWIKIKNKCGLF